MWNEVLKQLLVPGGLLSIFAIWWTTSHTKSGDTKTEVKDTRPQPQLSSTPTPVDEGWRELFDTMKVELNERIDDLEGELHATQDELAKTNAKLAAAQADLHQLQRRERIHIDYHYRLRYQVQGLGHDPAPWPAGIDPSI